MQTHESEVMNIEIVENIGSKKNCCLTVNYCHWLLRIEIPIGWLI